MKHYQARFTGRKIGAIGISYPMIRFVDAESKEAAQLALYEDYEDIHELRLVELELEKEENV